MPQVSTPLGRLTCDRAKFGLKCFRRQFGNQRNSDSSARTEFFPADRAIPNFLFGIPNMKTLLHEYRRAEVRGRRRDIRRGPGIDLDRLGQISYLKCIGSPVPDGVAIGPAGQVYVLNDRSRHPHLVNGNQGAAPCISGDLIGKTHRFMQPGRPSRAVRESRQRRLALERAQARTLLSGAAPPVPTGLVTVISDDGPTGEVSMTDFTNQLKTISNPDISGVALGIQWSSIEATEPANPLAPMASELDLCRINMLFAAAEAADKWVQLLIAPGFWTPQWVLADPFVVTDPFQPQYTNTKDETSPLLPLPVPWDNPVYYDYWFAFRKP